MADKAYSSAANRFYLRRRGIAAVIPVRRLPPAGDYCGREAVFGFVGTLRELAGGSLPHFDLHAVPADEHGVALVIGTISRDGRSLTWNGAHVFHLRDGKVAEFWDANTDQYAYDEFLG